MTRPSIKQVNTLPWGRPAADGSELDDDGETDWELLRQTALLRAELPGLARTPEGVLRAQHADEDPASADDEGHEQPYEQPGDEQAGYEQPDDAWQHAQPGDEQAYEPQAYEPQYAQPGYEQAYEPAYAQAPAYDAYDPQAGFPGPVQPAAQSWAPGAPGVDPFGHTVAHTFHAPEPNQFGAALDPFGAPAAFQGEPHAVQASPSFAPGQMLAPQSVSWDDEVLEPSATKPSRTWLWGALAAAALAIAGVVGMQSASAASEREAKIAAAEQARKEMVAADSARLAEEARVRELARLADEARAREAAGSSAVASMLSASVRSNGSAGLSAPMASRPTGLGSRVTRKAKAPARGGSRKGKAGHAAPQHAGDPDEGARSDDPIYGL